jgi:hypothetical protein
MEEPMDRDMMLAELSELLAPEEALMVVVLFGSQADGRARPDSDLDVAVLTCDKLSEQALQSLRLRLTVLLMEHFRIRADVVILNHAPPFLKQQIFNKGLEVFVRDHDSWIAFKVKGYREYFTFRHAMDIIFEAKKFKIRKELSHG